MLYLRSAAMYNNDMKLPFLRKKADSKQTFIVIGVAAAVATILSLWIGLQQSVWFDEAYSIIVAKQSPAEIVHLASVDVHPPLYYLLLHAWGGAFGWSELALRALSVLAFGGSVVVAALLVRKLFGDRAAMYTAVLVALSPLLVRYGFEIRMYSIASLLGVTATYLLVCARQAQRQSRRIWALYAVTLAVGMMTLYHLALLWVAHAVWLAVVDRKKLVRFWRLPWFWAYVGAAGLFLPWLPKFLSQISNGALANIGRPMNLEQLVGVVTFNTVYKPLWQINVIETILLLITMVSVGVAVRRMYQNRSSWQPVLLLTLYTAVPILLFMIASFAKPLYVERYLSHIAIGFAMLLGVALAGFLDKVTTRKRAWVYAGTCAVLGVGLYNLVAVGNFNFQRMQRPAVDLVAKSISCNNNSSVMAADPYVAIELAYYLPSSCNTHFYSQWPTMGGGYAPLSGSPKQVKVQDIAPTTPTLYYIYYGEPELHIADAYVRSGVATHSGLTVATYVAQ